MDDFPQTQFEPQLAVKREKRNIPTLSGPGIFWILIISALFLMVLAINIFGGSRLDNNTEPTPSLTDSPLETRQPRIYTISYKAGVFSPTNLKIHAGDTVRFKNDGIFSMRIISDPHPEHDDLVGFDSVGDIPQDSYFAFTFAAKGIFGYHNEKNIKEAGTIIVR